MTTILPITLTMAGAAAITNLWLGFRCGQVRMKTHIMLGDGDNEGLLARMRAHANFNEYTPIFLILLGLVELGSPASTPSWLWLTGALFIVGRVAHGLGMERPYPNKLRMFGTLSAMLLTLGLATYAIYLPHGAAGMITESGPNAAGPDAEIVPNG